MQGGMAVRVFGGFKQRTEHVVQYGLEVGHDIAPLVHIAER